MISSPFFRAIVVSRAACMAIFCGVLFGMPAAWCADASEVVLVSDGLPNAAVVLADAPSKVAAYAAEELVRHVEKASGAVLSVMAESADLSAHPVRVFVGETEAARRAGLSTDALKPDAFYLRTSGSNVFVLGQEKPDAEPVDVWRPGHGWAEQIAGSGTLYGVYELLDRVVGVRWLWPGELGTFVPATDRLAVASLDEVVEPAFLFRRFRWAFLRLATEGHNPYPDGPGAIRPVDEARLSYSMGGLHHYDADLRVYMRRHRFGHTKPMPRGGHVFGRRWIEQHAMDRPEWHMMREDGTRGPDRAGRTATCVSNPELHAYIVDEMWDGQSLLRLTEGDTPEYCRCPDCLAWDGPQPEETPRVFSRPSRNTSDRYAQFWKTVYARAKERNPDVTILGSAYMYYLPAPLTDIRLNERIYVAFWPWGPPVTLWFPASEERMQWVKEQWLGWARTGATMFLGTNHPRSGYAMPHINTRQLGDFLRFTYEHGSVGYDFAALYGQWAVRGLEYYLQFRFCVNPDLTTDQIRAEYFSGFGPAAEQVEAYFNYWEDYNQTLLEQGRWRNMYRWANQAPRQYPPDVFPPARSILDEALVLAQSNPRPEFADRVRYLQAGLENARLSVDMISKLHAYAADDPESVQSALDAFRAVIAFRRAHEESHIADFLRLADLERRAYGEQIEALYELLDE